MRKHTAAAKIGPLEVYVDHPVPLCLGEFAEWFNQRNSRTVCQDVDRAKTFQSGLDQVGDFRKRSDIAANELALAAKISNLLNDPLATVRIDVSDNRFDPLLRQAEANSPANSLCSARHNSSLSS